LIDTSCQVHGITAFSKNPLLTQTETTSKRKRSKKVSCCPNAFEWSLKRFLLINLGEAEDKRFELFDPPQAESFQSAWSEP